MPYRPIFIDSGHCIILASSLIHFSQRISMASPNSSSDILQQLVPFLELNVELEDYDIIESLHADDVITQSDVERYVQPLEQDKAKQVIQLLYD